MAVIEATQPMRTLSVVSRRSLLIGAAATAYVFVRVLFCVGATIDDLHPDIPSYRLTPSFTGANSRPWVVPSVQWLLSDSATVVVQAALSGVAFLALAYAIREQLTNTWVRNLAAGVVLLVGLSNRVTVWDAAMMSESLAITTTVGLMACLALLDRLPVWVPIVKATFGETSTWRESLVDHTAWHPTDNEPAGVPYVWPHEASFYSLGLVVLGGLSVLVCYLRRLRTAILPALLLASTIPHAMLVFHASPLEVARHGVILGLVLVLSSVWLIALAVDSFVSVSDAPLGDERSRLRGDVGVCLSAG